MVLTNKKDVSSRRVGTLKPPSHTKPLSKEICSDHIDTTQKKSYFFQLIPPFLASLCQTRLLPWNPKTCMHLHTCTAKHIQREASLHKHTYKPTHSTPAYNLSSYCLHLSSTLSLAFLADPLPETHILFMAATAGHPHFTLWQLSFKHGALKSQLQKMVCGGNGDTHTQTWEASRHGGLSAYKAAAAVKLENVYLDLWVTS